MTVQRIVKKNIGTFDPTTYVGNPKDVWLDDTIPVLKVSDGHTPGGVPLGLPGILSLGQVLSLGNTSSLGFNVGPSTFSSVYVSGISTFADDVHFDYNAIIKVGDNDDLQIYHNGSNAYIDNFSGNNLVIRDNGAGIQLRRYGGGPNAGLMANFNTGGGVELYYDSVLKLQTYQNGVAINDSVGIGSTASNPPYRLTVSGVGATITSGLANAIADLTSSVNGYGQVNIRNSFAGTNSSGDLVVTADNGSDTTNYIDLGINNSSFSSGSWTVNGAGDGYLYTSDSNLSIGVAATNKYLSLFAGGTLSSNEIIRVTSSSAVIGSAVTITSGGVRTSGIVTAYSFRPSGGYIQAADGTNSFYIYSSTGNVSFQGTIGASQVNSGTGYKVVGLAGSDASFVNNVNIVGIITAKSFIGGLIATGTAPATSTSTGTAGEIRYDSNYIYVCVATNTWKRVGIATW